MPGINTLSYYEHSLIIDEISLCSSRFMTLLPILPTTRVESGSTKAIGKEPKSCLARVFNNKLDCFDDVHVLIYADAHSHLKLKTRPRFSPVS